MKVSVITPVYNEEKNILSCYQHLCNQSYSNFEWVIIDDGSTDGTSSIVQSIINESSKRFEIVFIQQNNSGAYVARENGIKVASGDYICIVDCDDYLSNDAIEIGVSKLREEIDLVFFKMQFVDSEFVTKNFTMKSMMWPVKGITAFLECIDGWGLHGFFIAKKDIYLRAYESLSSNDRSNNVNNDELISRYCMYHANMVDLCDGIYHYVYNPASTTRKINNKYHRVTNTAIEFDVFIRMNIHDSIYQDKSNAHLLSVFWGVLVRYCQWYRWLDNPREWFISLVKISKHINFKSTIIYLRSSNKRTQVLVKLLFVSIFRLFPIGSGINS